MGTAMFVMFCLMAVYVMSLETTPLPRKKRNEPESNKEKRRRARQVRDERVT